MLLEFLKSTNMKKQHLLTIWLFVIGLLLGNSNVYAQFAPTTNLPLVASTEFKVIGGENDAYHSFDELNDFEGINTPTFRTNFLLPDSIVSTEKMSSFLNEQHYAITSNPSNLDSLRFYDNENSGEWGVIISNGERSTPTTPVFSMEVKGLKNNGKYRIVVEVCNPHSSTYLNNSGSNKAPHLNSGYNSALKIGVNNTLSGGIDSRPGFREDSCNVFEITTPSSATAFHGPIYNNKLTVNFYISQMAKGEAIMIKSIKVYAEVEPVILGKNSECVGGKDVTFRLDDTYKYKNCKYQWYKNGTAISGATNTTYTHTTGNVDGQEYTFYCEITTAERYKIRSKSFKFVDKACCTDGNGNPSDEKLIWQDDFGTFTQKGSYWVWDYSDISNPIKVANRTTDGWSYELSDSIPGARYNSTPDMEGTYSVAANITNSFDSEGTHWGWQAQTFYGKYPASDSMASGANTYQTPNGYVPDHTYNGYGYGAMLVLNCGNKANEVLYSRTIKNLCERRYTAKCYISNWSASEGPVKVKIRVTDYGSGKEYTSETVTRYSVHDNETVYDVTTAWEEVSISFDLTGDSLKLEIISEAGGTDQNKTGNDLILDDIQLWSCAVPNVDLYFDDLSNKSITSCEGKDLNLVASETNMISKFYQNNQGYIFQYTTGNPEDNKTWKPIPGSGISDSVKLTDLSAVFNEIDSGDKVYFRAILGSKETLETLGLSHLYNPNEMCAAYSVSSTIEALKKCNMCTASATNIKIKADKYAKYHKHGKNLIDLCYGESVTLSQAADITPDKADWQSDNFEGFAIKWFESENPGDMSDAKTVLNDVVEAKTINYDDSSLVGTELPVLLYAVDAKYPNGSCKTADTIYIRFNKAPDGEFRTPNTEFCEGEGHGMIDTTLTNGVPSNYIIHWWKGADTLSGTPLGDNKDEKFFEEMKSEDSGIFTYQLVDYRTGCAGDFHNFEVTVNATPDAPKEENIQYTINGDSSEVLTTEKFAQTLDESMKLIWFNSVDEPNSKGSYSVEIDRSAATTNPYVFYIAYKDGYCYSKRSKVEVIISPLDNIKSIATDNDDEIVNVYTVSGALVKANVKKSEALRGLSNGSYIVGDQKVIVK